ncbi:4Fe-4S cluster-binding domain-containing protein [Scytonema sp. UIC 10036]|uniref:4Fe-4S single cluster domain-containing protein n=1 Tax=Scytonema sp. UIC 10036 TaxID=2304196 RepID=UPI0012DAAEF0|nr:4Fe-4S single cluster domain-containing protein [Scytonema sp. UIC 10036]MUG95791.1 4Fe-4S cluster-binding domain-containing protein [Scytonema sp. UIC 10036]
MSTSFQIQVATYLPESYSNGPGCRAVLWVQGCPKRCSGCWNPDFLSFKGGTVWTVAQALEKLTQSDAIEGITLLGGEPFSQAEPLSNLCAEIRQHGLSVMAYSGWTLTELTRMGSPQTDLLACCDLLVDGEFVAESEASLLWRGSYNQQIHFLTERYAQWRSQVNNYHRDFEILIQDEQLILTGDPPAAVLQMLQGLLPQGEWQMR